MTTSKRPDWRPQLELSFVFCCRSGYFVALFPADPCRPKFLVNFLFQVWFDQEVRAYYQILWPTCSPLEPVLSRTHWSCLKRSGYHYYQGNRGHQGPLSREHPSSRQQCMDTICAFLSIASFSSETFQVERSSKFYLFLSQLDNLENLLYFNSLID